MRSSRSARQAGLAAGLLATALGWGCAGRTPGLLAVPSPVSARAHEVRELQQDVAQLVASPALRRGLVAVHVESLDRGDTLFSYHADRLVMPASNMKILTLAAAVHRLGWDYRFQTFLRAAGPIADGVLHGDLLLQGTGDPSINGRSGRADQLLSSWAGAVAARGIRAITGRVIGDGRAFEARDRHGPGWAWDDLPYGYAAPVSGLQINEDAVELTIVPGAAVGDAAAVTAVRADTGLAITSEVTTAGTGTEPSISLARLPGSSDLLVTGQVPLCGEVQKRLASIESPEAAFAAALSAALRARGIAVGGDGDVVPAQSDGRRTAAHSAAPSSWSVPLDQPIAVDVSPPLRELAVVLMKASQNLYAETLLRAIGRVGDAPATVDGGREAFSAAMAALGVQDDAFAVADGSGLSRYNLVTAGALVQVLRRFYQDPVSREPWLAALPVGGTDGTLEKRFRGSAAEGRVLAKTGTIAYVRALSGYVRSAGGEQLVFSIIVNNTTAPGDVITGIVDAIVNRLAAFRR
jgi:D-alanyl-D-alanine carboxypeptidase/D-alanyl-D-alanine-endopeptidase (penicillin-binding protein 4)